MLLEKDLKRDRKTVPPNPKSLIRNPHPAVQKGDFRWKNQFFSVGIVERGGINFPFWYLLRGFSETHLLFIPVNAQCRAGG